MTVEERLASLEAKKCDEASLRREGAALALEQLAADLDSNFTMFDDLCPRRMAKGLRKRANAYRSGERVL